MAGASTGASINYRRFAVAALAAGVLLNAVTAMGNSTVFKSSVDLWAASMTGHLAPPRPPLQITLWTLMCLIDALIGVWIYSPCARGLAQVRKLPCWRDWRFGSWADSA